MPVDIPAMTPDLLDALKAQTTSHFEIYLTKISQRSSIMIASGIDPEEVFKILLTDVENNAGEFKDLTGSLGSTIDQSIGQTSIQASIEPIVGLSNQWKWVWEPSAEHCPTCEERNGQIDTYDNWVARGIPGAGTTVCKIYCRCSLIPQ